MRGDPARLQRDADQVFMRYQRQLRQRQLLGHDDGWLVEGAFAAFLAQMAQYPMADITEVGRALAQIAIGDIEHLRRQLIDDTEQRTLGGETLLDGFPHPADELLVFENHAMAVENLQVGFRHHRCHARLECAQLGERPRERLLEALLLGLHVTGAQVAIDGAHEGTDHMRPPIAKPGAAGNPDQARAANLDRRGNPSLAADLLVILELTIGLDHPAAIFLALLLLGGEGLAQAEMRKNLRDLVGRGLEQARFTLGELAPGQRLDHQHADRLVAPVLHRHAEESVIALLAGLGEIFVARMADRIGNADRLALLDHQADQAFVRCASRLCRPNRDRVR